MARPVFIRTWKITLWVSASILGSKLVANSYCYFSTKSFILGKSYFSFTKHFFFKIKFHNISTSSVFDPKLLLPRPSQHALINRGEERSGRPPYTDILLIDAHFSTSKFHFEELLCFFSGRKYAVSNHMDIILYNICNYDINLHTCMMLSELLFINL